jgi:hypothetical protein
MTAGSSWALIVLLGIGRGTIAQDGVTVSNAVTTRADRSLVAAAVASGVGADATATPAESGEFTPQAPRTVGRGESMPPRLRVDLVFDGPPMPPRLESSAMEEVIRIWTPYGVDVQAPRWTSAGRNSGVRLAVVLADLPAGHTATETLGSIQFHGGLPETQIVMYPKAIERLVSAAKLYGRESSEWPTNFRYNILGRVLGRALAHEIGHYLLRSSRHSSSGLMRSILVSTDLVAPDRHPFVLSTGDAARLVSVSRVE